ncbi:molecular chaperone [Acinetobacter baumannii]
MWNVNIHTALLRGAFSLSAVLLCANTNAGSLQVAPIMLQFAGQDRAKELWLSNNGDTPIKAQVRVQEWQQSNGEEKLSSTQDLIASPLILSIKPGDKQLVRIIRPKLQSISVEQAFRLIIDELPVGYVQQNNGLNILLKYSIPVFVEAKPRIAEKQRGFTNLDGVSYRFNQGQLTIHNTSSNFIRLNQPVYISTNGQRYPLSQGLLGYVLAGQTMKWTVNVPGQAQSNGKLTAVINHDFKEQEIPMAQP